MFQKSRTLLTIGDRTTVSKENLEKLKSDRESLKEQLSDLQKEFSNIKSKLASLSKLRDTRVPPANATFVYPAPGDQISLKTDLRGTVTPARPERGSYWIIIRDDDGDFYPQDRIAALPNGTWTHFLTLGPAWKGRPVEVLVALGPDKQANEVLLGSVRSENSSRLPNNVSVLATLNLKVQP